MSMPLTPSTSEWWVLEMIAKRPPREPSTSQQLPQRLGAVQALGEDPRRRACAAARSSPGLRQRGVAHVVLEVEARVVDPARAAEPGGRVGELLAVARHAGRSRPRMCVEQVVERRRLAASKIATPPMCMCVRRRPPGAGRPRPRALSAIEVLLRCHEGAEPTWSGRRMARGLRRWPMPMRHGLQGRPHHRLLDRASAARRPSGSPGAAGPSTRRRAAPRRSPSSRRGLPRLLALDVTDEASMRAAVDAGRRRAGRGRRAGQQRRLQPVGRDRDGRHGRRAPPVRDQRLRARCACASSRCRRCATQGWGRIVNISSMGGELRLPGRRHLPRDQVRGGGDQRRAALRGQAASASTSSIIQPGLIRTELRRHRGRGDRPRSGDGALRRLQRDAWPSATKEAYEERPAGQARRRAGGRSRRTIEKAITARKPEDPLPRHAERAHAHRRSAG